MKRLPYHPPPTPRKKKCCWNRNQKTAAEIKNIWQWERERENNHFGGAESQTVSFTSSAVEHVLSWLRWFRRNNWQKYFNMLLTYNWGGGGGGGGGGDMGHFGKVIKKTIMFETRNKCAVLHIKYTHLAKICTHRHRMKKWTEGDKNTDVVIRCWYEHIWKITKHSGIHVL